MSEQAIFDDDILMIAARLRAVLAHMGVSQTDLARKMGMSTGYVSEVARGLKRPGTDLLLALKREFEVSIDWLLTGAGSMFGGVGIRHDLLRAILIQIAVARAAVVDGDPVAKDFLRLIADGQLGLANEQPLFRELLERIAPDDRYIDLAVELYNGHAWTSDPNEQRRNILASAIAHFQARKPVDKMTALLGETNRNVQINIGKKQRVAGRDYNEK
ncbi:helix-turn-helix domain-containing protein [Roseateles violae]|uniref:Helix-turn-helix transcriptional regulator n=1 Tax=Roseateles violae TaxID=3058042 RepID=A0ABT8DYD0_9BURK|nr:helix-turn-helix transcriptional regulator [Pelomonas sp. PFR6]MDN3922517.1 helix-turn-helix transcriptional regulator [Pelomonas sp. PFR6]